MRSAIWSRKPSPRPTAPAGGETTSLAASVLANSARSAGSMRCSKLASTTTVVTAPGCSARKAATASFSWARLGSVRPSVARLDPSITKRSATRGLPGDGQQVRRHRLQQLVVGLAIRRAAQRVAEQDVARDLVIGEAVALAERLELDLVGVVPVGELHQ